MMTVSSSQEAGQNLGDWELGVTALQPWHTEGG